MTFDIEKMLREGASAEEVSRRVTAELNAAQKKIDAETKAAKEAEAKKAAEAAAKAEKRKICETKAKIAADALNSFLREEGIITDKEEAFTAKDLLDGVEMSVKDVTKEFNSLLSSLFDDDIFRKYRF